MDQSKSRATGKKFHESVKKTKIVHIQRFRILILGIIY